jgi:hypothetical protein
MQDGEIWKYQRLKLKPLNNHSAVETLRYFFMCVGSYIGSLEGATIEVIPSS